ncbi:MFS transporter [Rhizobium sp. B230/85]|nr:MFS transporter [Rhizobium sp. L58/93]MBO9136399.1 MFS transporter [Rhizobium sp. B209b/85]MBO9166897.1 MFS transporter [Rhizobium sp. L245/93]MBO9182869.1 MFS transporter [Rhizobium sp. E27B/91]QXZ85841.1 MFS transporter [Rhizobium sp. K1/93]QXZ91977.1 MFS transporter [Rhizobium sp. K15/93]QXZ97917.1 MFS transporter [Rhizobium sp. B230/85]QYA03327.1 MFS transporter [Rhizobium sp. B21/90]
MHRGTIPLMAAACGVMVGNIYICQPLLGQIAVSFGVPEHVSSLVAVATQVGYAFGILLLVPLADIAEPRRLLRWLMALTAIGLLGAALAPGIGVLVGASACLALVTVVPQVLIPLATSLVPAEKRGRVVGTMTTGLVMGILLSRTVSGLVAGYTDSWRASYGLAAVLTLILFFFVPAFMPQRPQTMQKMSYGKLLASLVPLLKHRPLLLSMGMNFLAFGAFSAFWATLAFHLASPAFGLGAAAAGLFGLWGAPGALMAPIGGRLADRWGSSRVNALAFCALLASFAIAATLGTTHLLALVVAVNLLDFGLQSGQIANQTRIFAIGHEIRGRLNTMYMVSTFSGGALGAFAGGMAWTLAGWIGVCLVCVCLICLAATLLGVSLFFGVRRTSAGVR